MRDLTERGFGGMIGWSPAMQEVYAAIQKAAGVEAPVLLTGETGTGKELVAQEIHARSERSNKPFVAVNTGALTSELVASELFGHAKGAFTGAIDSRGGRFREADGGVLFLDEVTTMEERVQVALLRVLESGTFRPVGASGNTTVDVRVIAATNEDLDTAVEKGSFRADLRHRLGVFLLALPPLRQRTVDIPVLAEAFLDESNSRYGAVVEGIEGRALDVLVAYSWPGNVRELRNVIAQGVILAQSGRIMLNHLPPRISRSRVDAAEAGRVSAPVPRAYEGSGVAEQEYEPGNGTARTAFSVTEHGVFLPFGTSWQEAERFFGLKTLEFCASNKTRTAEMLGVSRKTLYDKLRRWETEHRQAKAVSQTARATVDSED